ncbi:putative phosphotransferase YvkC [Nymphon striatum]|nr:putative phosphotransferase YvkC [Nymphon striatum]
MTVVTLKHRNQTQIQQQQHFANQGPTCNSLDNILDQYDQWGSFQGTYMIDDGPETEMILFGSKIRKTGNFRHSDIHQLIQIKGYVEDGSTFSINAINIPYKIPEMIWGYVELADSYRNLLTSSDFDFLRFKDLDSSPEMLSIRFKTDGDEYILDMTCHNGNFTHLWGAEEHLKAKCNNIKVCLTSLYHGVGLKGSGMFSVLSKNNIQLEAPKNLPPLLLEPGNFSEHIELLNILEISEECCQSSKLVGGKGSSLAILEKLFKESKLSESLIDEIYQKMVNMFGEKFGSMSFSVRSSAIGQQNGQPINVGMGVVVQEMVDADTAGVLFTRDPVNGNPAVISIAANYGIGESVVSAMSEPDTIVVRRTYDNKLVTCNNEVRNKISVNTEKGGVEENQTSEEDTKLCCLQEEEAMKLAEIGILVEQSYGNSRDIEWAISKKNIFLLQARPITNLHNDSEYILKNEFNTPIFCEHDCSTSGNIKDTFLCVSSISWDHHEIIMRSSWDHHGIIMGSS